MKKILLGILLIISLTCAMRDWQFNFGFRATIFNLLEILFILSFLIYSTGRQFKFAIKKKQLQLISFFIIWIIIVLIGDIISIIFPISDYSINQSVKGILITLLTEVFFITLVIFFNTLKPEEQKKIIKYFVFGVIVSALYSYVNFYSMKVTGKNLDSKIWPMVSYHYVFTDKSDRFDMIFRLHGVTGGPNPQALYILLILPILTGSFFLKKSTKLLVLLFILYIAFFFTLSRSSILALFIILIPFIFSVIKKRRTFKIVVSFMLILIPMLLLAYHYWDDISIILKSRQFFEDSNRMKIYQHAFDLFLSHPLGVGFNNYSAYRLFLYGQFSQPNAHNSWLTLLAEDGIQGLIFYILYFLFFLKATFKSRSPIAIPYRYSLIGIIIAVTFNNTLSLFFVQYFIILFFLFINSDTEFDFFIRKRALKSVSVSPNPGHLKLESTNPLAGASG